MKSINFFGKQNLKSGFTIIEVVLVLAIAGLIFLMVFIALPALQRNQRDTLRRQDVGHVLSALNNYRSNNQNRFPTVRTSMTTVPGAATWPSWGGRCEAWHYSPELRSYYEGDLSSETVTVCVLDQDHTGSNDGLLVHYAHAAVDRAIGLLLGGRCNDPTQQVIYTNKAVAAAVVRLEGGGYFCQNI